jgi:hypothetical protein
MTSARRAQEMLRKCIVLAILLVAATHVEASSNNKPRYVFTLPAGYVGWIQVIFNDPNASPLRWKDNQVLIEVPESGIPRTSSLRVHAERTDEFYYRSSLSNGAVRMLAVPSEYVMTGDSHGGFGVMDTGGKGRGYSWFIFIGPPTLRAKVPLANFDEVVATHRKLYGNAHVAAPDPYPTPGRIPLADPAKP